MAEGIGDIQLWPVFLVLTIFGVAIYGMIIGFSGVIFGIAARRRHDPQPSTNRRDAIRCGRRALIAGGVVIAILVLGVNANVLELYSWRSLLLVEPALLLGLAAFALARPKARPGISVVDLMGFVAWVGLGIAAPIELSAFDLYLDREARETITETHARLKLADKSMEKRYREAIELKGSSSRKLQARESARHGLSDARSGLRAANRLLSKTPYGSERQQLLKFHTDFAHQVGRYKGFVHGLGEAP
jgi:hypothetical protein